MTQMLECGRTTLSPADVPTDDTPDPPDELWRCVRELGHDGAHVGVLAAAGQPQLHWRDSQAGTDADDSPA